MKYSKMLCWINEETKAEFLRITDKHELFIFAEDYKDFKNKISDDFYLAISLKIADKNLKDLSELLHSFQNKNFRIILDFNGRLSSEVVNAFTYANKRYHNYTIKQLIEDFYKKLKDE